MSSEQMEFPEQEDGIGGQKVVVDNSRMRYESLCRDLNMDRETEEIAWTELQEVSKRSSLEGDPMPWFACALFSCGHESYVPTVGGPHAVVRGNCVSLNKLLLHCNLSLSDFFKKIRTWHELANHSPSFLEQISKLEHCLSITFVLYQHYDNIFFKLFLSSGNEKKNLKNRSVTKCPSSKLYDLCWVLFLCAKNENPQCTVDIVTPFHLLLCCIDFIYRNVLSEVRIDLINPNFEGVPKKWNTPEYDPSTAVDHCIVSAMCRHLPALPDLVKSMKNNEWRNIIVNFLQTNTIYGNPDSFLEIVSSSNYERNFKSLNNCYEHYTLAGGGFDERILLSTKPSNSGALNIDGIRMEPPQEIKALIAYTPYTRTNALPIKETNSEPLATAKLNVKKLHDIAHMTEPTDIIKQFGDVIVSKIFNEKQRLSEAFISNFPNKSEGKKRFELAMSLFNFLLDKIVRSETNRKPHTDLRVLLDKDEFHTTLIACCVEIVLGAYNSQLKLRWVLDTFSITAFSFMKIIEIVVRVHDGILTRDLIKHLNYVEEICLESLVWEKNSNIWELISDIKSNPNLQTWSDVDVSQNCRRNNVQLISPTETASETFSVSENPRPRVGPVAILLRKFYKLAWLRLKKLCNDLNMGGEEYLNEIWDLFEYSITHKSKELIQGRHLDQILMCAIYVYIKVLGWDKMKFADIMKFYRNQPQATSSTYRQVYIQTDPNTNVETYCDIIYFYNKIYVANMRPYALQFQRNNAPSNLTLSPHPSEIRSIPTMLSNSLSVITMEKKEYLHSPKDSTYEFGKSPGRELKRLNDLVNGKHKRILPFTDAAPLPSKLPRESSF